MESKSELEKNRKKKKNLQTILNEIKTKHDKEIQLVNIKWKKEIEKKDLD